MRKVIVAWFILSFLWCLAAPAAEGPQQGSSMSTAKELMRLRHLADEAHERGEIKEEIEYRRSYSTKAWAVERTARTTGIEKWLLIYLNDMPLGILLEGDHQWPDAEAMFRRNQDELAREPLAGDDIKSENQLQLAHLLAREGKHEEASRICAYWERRVKRIGHDAVFDAAHSDLAHAPDDSPEVEVGAWDLACGRPEDGMRLLKEQMTTHPRMLAPYTVLSEYYYADGDFEKGLMTETEGVWTLLGEAPVVETQLALSKSNLN